MEPLNRTALVEAVIAAYNTTRFSDVRPVDHVLGKGTIQRAFDNYERGIRFQPSTSGTSHERANAFIDNLAVSLGATTLPDPTKAITLPYRELFHALVALFDTPRTTMSEEEMLRRAREAAIIAYGDSHDAEQRRIRAGGCDDFAPVRGALAALRNLDKPLPEPINPLVLKAREIAAKHMHPAYRDQLERGALDGKPVVLAILEALRGD